MDSLLIWIGIFFCVTQSAMFSGLNLAFFSLTRLRLEIEVEALKSKGANKVLLMRKDSNFLLTTILWGNVGINVLLTLLSDSVMTGLVSFTFSTVIITFFGEIIPQAYFSRNALKMASLLAPVLRFYQFVLYPVAKPSAILLDKWLGKEAIQFLPEEIIKKFIQKHLEGRESEIDRIEGIGAINFLNIDDTKVIDEGEEINPKSIVKLTTNKDDELVFPEHQPLVNDPFIKRINDSGEKWIIFTDEDNIPKLALDADGFIRSIYSEQPVEDILKYCHKPMILDDENIDLGTLIFNLRQRSDRYSDTPIDRDIAIIWLDYTKKIITGADIFGRLLKGI